MIFVRQGYKPQELVDFSKCKAGTIASTKWSSFNLIADGLEAQDPRDEGSLFKFGNLDEPIDAINNAYNADSNGDGDVLLQSFAGFSSSKLPKDNLLIVGKDGKLMADKKSFATISHYAKFDENSKISTIHDFEQLYLTPFIQFGYGVLYADGATETQVKVQDIFGYNRWSPTTKPNGESIRGMRGVFAYFYNDNDPSNTYSGRNIFFPIGRSAYGHRKQEDAVGGSGTLRYNCGSTDIAGRNETFSSKAPLFVSACRREGAIYWAKEKLNANQYLGWNNKDGEGVGIALDLNYFTFDVNTITTGNVKDGADACFIRCVSE